MSRIITTSFIIVLGIIGISYWSWKNNPQITEQLKQYLDKSDIITLEARYTPEQIMKAHSHELLNDDRYKYQKPALTFHPYLLIEAKYTAPNKKTREGTLLWSLVDGEMILDTDTWDKTHGFQDALLVNATRNEFKVMNALAKNGGSMTKEQLNRELNIDQSITTNWIDSARNKHLIIQKGDLLSLHFQNPKILVTPQTKIGQWLVTKPYSHQRVPKKFTRKQIEKIAKAAFGEDFTVRSMQEVSLPVYSIGVLNPDGSVHTSFWNALNGQKINPRSFAY
ncbi:MAG: hypothetical protein AAGG81_01670 [Chlamydiota bacterium]